jgi:biotin/lipoyl-binding protein
VAVIALAAVSWVGFSDRGGGQTSAAEMPPPRVTVSKPLLRDVDTRIGLLGQFSAIDCVELRAQVGGTITEIHFKDGQIVQKGDLLGRPQRCHTDTRGRRSAIVRPPHSAPSRRSYAVIMQLRRSGTESSLTLRRRDMDSKFQFRARGVWFKALIR